MTNKEILKTAKNLIQKINIEYNKLDGNSFIFELFHDDISIQLDCSIQEFDELEEYIKLKDKESINFCMQNLKDTLIYCKAVINLQNEADNLPKSIYG